MKQKKNRVLLAIGLLLVCGSNLVQHIFPINDFANGFLKGIGIAFMIVSIYRMKYKTAC